MCYFPVNLVERWLYWPSSPHFSVEVALHLLPNLVFFLEDLLYSHAIPDYCLEKSPDSWANPRSVYISSCHSYSLICPGLGTRDQEGVLQLCSCIHCFPQNLLDSPAIPDYFHGSSLYSQAYPHLVYGFFYHFDSLDCYVEKSYYLQDNPHSVCILFYRFQPLYCQFAVDTHSQLEELHPYILADGAD